MHVTIVGLGLIGGSIARCLRTTEGGADGWIVDGWSPSARTRSQALESGAIRAVVPLEQAVASSDLVVLAAPPLACLELLERIGGPLRADLRSGATITDVASTKGRIVARADSLRLPFVGGHPMAGREASGFGAATADLFAGRPWVLVPGATATRGDAERVAELARACGARPIEMDAATHDAAVAAISHLPLVLATALVEAVVGRSGQPDAPDWPSARALAAGGWRDMTRLARGDAAMGAGIAATNAGPLRERLEAVRGILDEWIGLLADGSEGIDAAALQERFAAAGARLDGPRLPEQTGMTGTTGARR